MPDVNEGNLGKQPRSLRSCVGVAAKESRWTESLQHFTIVETGGLQGGAEMKEMDAISNQWERNQLQNKWI